MKLSSARIRAYSRTMDAGMRTIDEVEEEYRVMVYVELVTRHDWQFEEVDERYIEEVKKDLGIK